MQPAQTAALRLLQGEVIALDAVSATGLSADIDVSQCGNVGICIIGENDATPNPAVGTVKVRGSFKLDANIDLSQASTKNNPWEYLAISQYLNGNIASGLDGIGLTENATRNCELNQADLRTIAIELALYTSGKFTVLVYGANNE